MGQLNLFKDRGKFVQYHDKPLDTSGSKDIRHTTYGSVKWMGGEKRIPKHKVKKGEW